jgi:osmoprotectant transport system ATP-binding protein
MVTHDVQEAVLLADRVVVMSGGHIVADDTPGALLSGDASPEVSALMAMPRRQAERISNLLQAGGHEMPRHPPHG